MRMLECPSRSTNHLDVNPLHQQPRRISVTKIMEADRGIDTCRSKQSLENYVRKTACMLILPIERLLENNSIKFGKLNQVPNFIEIFFFNCYTGHGGDSHDSYESSP